MSIRNFVPMMNAPPPPHHRVQTLQAVNVMPQQGQPQGSANSNQNGSAPPSHEYHFMPCIPFQTPGAAPAPNLIRHMQNGSYAHPPNQQMYQTQGGQVVTNQQPQSNQQQPLQGTVQQNPARLTPMSQPTAPPTPPQQQQPSGPQQQAATQYVHVQTQGIPNQQAGANSGNPRPTQYRPQSQGPRRQQMAVNQNGQWVHIGPGPHLTQMPGFPYVAPINARPTYYNIPYSFINPYQNAQQYGQIAGNNQQRQTTQNPAPAPMTQPQTAEYSYGSIEMYPTVMQTPVTQPVPPQASHQKAPYKKPGSKAIAIINPNTNKSIFEEDANGIRNSTTSTSSNSSSTTTTEKPVPSPLDVNIKVEEDKSSSGEPSTPIVSAMSDGPSIEITPKHQINKSKKIKPPESTQNITSSAVPAQQPTQVEEPVQQSQPVEATKVIVPEVISEPPPSLPPVQLPAPTTTTTTTPQQQVPTQSQDNENNNNVVTNANQILTPQTTSVVYAEEVVEVKAKEEEVVVAQVSAPAAANGQDANDTNNNNYQISTSSSESVKEKEREPQDSNNNDKSTDVPSNIRSSSVEPAPTPAVVERPSRKISVIDYIGDQWSPENESGKKYYTRDQLLKLKDQLIASMEPGLHPNVAQIVMKNNKETLNNTLTQTMPPPGMQMPRNAPYDALGSVAPKFMNQLSRSVYPKRPSQQGGNNKQAIPGRGSVQGPLLKINLGVQEDVKLNESENAWKPKHLQRGTDLTEEQRETSDLLNSFRSMLNKLTAENFDTLVDEVKKFKINTLEKLNGVISLLFEKAISEPKFAPTYAKLCREVCNVHTLVETSENRTGTNQQNQKSTFKKNLISQCQKEFERHKEEAIVFNEIEEEMIQIEKLPDAEREEKKASLEEKHFKIRQRANGTVKFIGELYKIDMLTFKIMNQCVNILLEQPTEEKVERVCKLLTTIGMKMEQETQGSLIDQHFDTLTNMLHPNSKVIRSSRIRFEIQNLQDLRRNKWKERRADQIPRTMGEIVSEAEREHQLAYQRNNMKDDRNRGGNNFGNNRGGRNQQDNDGWNNVGGGNKQRSTPITLKMIPAMNVISSETTAKLGNPTNYQNFSFSSNKFSGLATDCEDGPIHVGGSGGGGSKNSSMERSQQNRGYYGNNNGNAPYSGRSSGSNQGSRNSSQNRSRDNSNDIRGGASRSMQGSLPSRNSMNLMDTVKQNKSASVIASRVVTPFSEPMSKEDVKKNTEEFTEILDLFIKNKKTMEVALEDLKKLRYNKEVLAEGYNKYIDGKRKDRVEVVSVICGLIKNQYISAEDNRAALVEVMEIAPELEIDVPKIYEYFADYMAELLFQNKITFKEIYSIVKNDSEKMLKYILSSIKNNDGNQKMQEIVADSKFDLRQFLEDRNIERFSKDYDLSLDSNKVNIINKSSENPMNVLKKMFADKKTTDEVINFIVSLGTKENLVSDLTKAVVEYCCDELNTSGQVTYKIKDRLPDLCLVLQRFIDNELKSKLYCIEELFKFAAAREFPQGLLNTLFEILYDNDVITTDAFESWKKDAEKKPGYGVVLKSTNQFFTKLGEEIEDDEDDEDDDDL